LRQMMGAGTVRRERARVAMAALLVCVTVVAASPSAFAAQVPITVRSLEIEGLEALDPPVELPEVLPLQPGDAYTTERLEALEEAIREAFAERGHPYAEVEISADVDEVAGTADIRIAVDPGAAAVFGPIELRVESPIREADVRARLAYAQGEPFRPSAIAETVRRLRALPIAGEVVIQPVGLEAGAPVVPTIVIVPSLRVQAIEVEGTISSARCLELAGYWRHRYFLGAPRQFSLGFGFRNLFARSLGSNFPCTEVGDDPYRGIDWFADMELRQPLPNDPATAIGVRLFGGRESVPQVYVWEGFGATGTLVRELRPGVVGTFRYAPVRQRFFAANLYFCGNFGLCDDEEIEDVEEPHWFAPVEAELLVAPVLPPRVLIPRDELRRMWIERRVFSYWLFAGADGAAGPTGSEYDYIRASGEGAVTRYWRLGEIAARARLGAIGSGGVLPPQVRFFSGGLQTVRGADQNMVGPLLLVASPAEAMALGCALEPLGCPPGTEVDENDVDARPTGGDAVVEANVEARIWAGRRVQLAAFLDYGLIARWRDGDGSPAFALPGSGGLFSPGIGVRALTPLGPIRVDVALDTRPARLFPLFTEDPDTGDIIFLGNVLYDPHGDGGGSGEFFRRLRLHVGMGQPF